ncbi:MULTISPECIES: RDD family protein [unclassified Streptomyces]|uniref:RDD family protein n=1 Tax=unclassified Streptomyces TaxID=2593676 RepID=UPI0006ADD0A5|nr:MULTISPECIES: RDD family protein [unclassified Streptomyces]KOX24638.1 RDD domain-containing membrane protein [Streptomyces sp. NRRL F-6491]KOX40401.1 RDD domain-containing membrane protein [Streptomyces sp. NRRL F-6492]
MSTDQPPPGPPPDEDPFRKRPQEPPPPSGGQPPPGGQPPGGPPPGGPPPGGPPPGNPYGSPYDNAPPPPPPYGGGYGGGYGGTDPLAGMPPLADSGRRILARLIDWVIVVVPLAIIGIPFKVYDRVTTDDDFGDAVTSFNGGGQLVFQLITIVAFVAYDTVLTARNGRTLGKKLMKLRVAMLNDGSTPPMSQSLLRAVVLWLPALICCACLWPLLLLILILVDKPYKQGLHDKAAKTVVVSTPQ